MRNHFKPEFLNRIDEIVVFHRLDEAHIERIVEIQVEQLRERLAERNLGLELTEAALAHIATRRLRPRLRGPAAQAGDPAGGRATRSRSALLKGEYHDGDIVVVDATADGSLIFSSAQEPITVDLTVTCGGRLTDVRDGGRLRSSST